MRVTLSSVSAACISRAVATTRVWPPLLLGGVGGDDDGGGSGDGVGVGAAAAGCPCARGPARIRRHASAMISTC